MLNKTDKAFLYMKYTQHLGFESCIANKKIREFENQIRDIHIKLLTEGRSDDDINKKFKEEFEKLCQRLEVEREKRKR